MYSIVYSIVYMYIPVDSAHTDIVYSIHLHSIRHVIEKDF